MNLLFFLQLAAFFFLCMFSVIYVFDVFVFCSDFFMHLQHICSSLLSVFFNCSISSCAHVVYVSLYVKEDLVFAGLIFVFAILNAYHVLLSICSVFKLLFFVLFFYNFWLTKCNCTF